MYVEKQQGNMCRKHALNAFFGGAILQWGDVERHAENFEYFYNLPSTNNMKNDIDFFNSDGSSLLTWIADQIDPNYFYMVLPCGKVDQWLEELKYDSVEDLIEETPNVMVFNKDHVYSIKKKDHKWYVLDSLSPQPYAIPSLRQVSSERTNGMVVSLNRKTASQVAFNLEQNMQKFLNNFPNLHTETVSTFLNQGTIGDVHDTFENWALTRLRLLSWIRGRKSRTKKVFNHIQRRHLFPEEKKENKTLLTYGVVLS